MYALKIVICAIYASIQISSMMLATHVHAICYSFMMELLLHVIKTKIYS